MPDPFADVLDDDEVDTNREQDAATKRANAERRKQEKVLEAEVTELRAFKADREKFDRENTIGTVFAEVGLNPKHAKLYAALNPEGDATPQTVAQFAADYGLTTTEGEPVAVPEVPATGFVPTVITEGTALGSKMYSHEEFMELLQTNPEKAMQLHKAGRVRLNQSPQTVFYGRDR